MTVFDVVKRLLSGAKDTENWIQQESFSGSPYVECAYSFDRLGYGKILLIDFKNGSFPYISSSIISKIHKIKSKKVNMGYIENNLDESQFEYISNILKSFLDLLKKPISNIKASVLHFDISIYTALSKELIHISITPCLFDAGGTLVYGLCMLTFSPRETQGNVIVKLPNEDYHLELVHNNWEEKSNSHLTSMERTIIANSANGKSIKEIAESLSVTIATVKTHRYHIFDKLGVKNITEAVQYVEDYDLI